MKKIGRFLLPIFVIFGVGGIVDQLLGANAFVSITLLVVVVFAAVQTILKARAAFKIRKLGVDDPRPVRVECVDALAARFADIAHQKGWDAENPQAISLTEVSIRFLPADSSCPAKDLLAAFNKAGLVQNIRA